MYLSNLFRRISIESNKSALTDAQYQPASLISRVQELSFRVEPSMQSRRHASSLPVNPKDYMVDSVNMPGKQFSQKPRLSCKATGCAVPGTSDSVRKEASNSLCQRYLSLF